MAKTAVVKTRIDDKTLSEIEQLAAQMEPPVTVSALMRQAMVEYIARKRVVHTDRLMLVADGESLSV
jgi:antitoxin component of RelBE/YafQ-DinJ toxin-antitoxin module